MYVYGQTLLSGSEICIVIRPLSEDQSMKLKIFYILISLKMCQILENSVVIYLNSELLYLKFIVFADSSIVKNSNKRLQSI